ncbi:hypothetical protein QQ045_026011 [Rhodiola kirilowii]
MESTNPIHPRSLPSSLVNSSGNVPSSSMIIRAVLNPPRRSSPITIRTIGSRIPRLKILNSNFGMTDPQQTEAQIKPSKSDKENEEEKIKSEDDERVDPPPPPPEKPLPDDCCGSGCVRCVWDMYYDELEEYNKLYANK